MDKLEECREQLLQLAESSMATNRLAKRAALLAAGYWDTMDRPSQEQLKGWLHWLHIDSQGLVGLGAPMQKKLRRAEVAMGAIEACSRPARGWQR